MTPHESLWVLWADLSNCASVGPGGIRCGNRKRLAEISLPSFLFKPFVATRSSVSLPLCVYIHPNCRGSGLKELILLLVAPNFFSPKDWLFYLVTLFCIRIYTCCKATWGCIHKKVCDGQNRQRNSMWTSVLVLHPFMVTFGWWATLFCHFLIGYRTVLLRKGLFSLVW